ncbi:MAG: PKD domain-containing protein [Myxococcota bacterium]
MRGLSLALIVVTAACGSSVSNPHDAGDADVHGDDEPTDQISGQQVTAAIVDGARVADAARTISLAAVPVDADQPTYTWSFGDGTTATGLSTSHTYASHGCYNVTLTVSAPGATSANAATNVYAPADLDVDLDPLPFEHALVPRREPYLEFAELPVSGTIASPGWQTLEVQVIADDVVVANYTAPLCSTTAAAFVIGAAVPVAPRSHDIVVRATVGDRVEVIASTSDIVGGDVIVIQGQSNAVAANYQGVTLDTDPFVRTFGSAAVDEGSSVADNSWRVANGNVANGAGSIGQWGMKMAHELVLRHEVPLAIFNGAHGGQPIGFFQRDDANHANTTTNYGRLLRRLGAAGVAPYVRAVLYFQGESDSANAVGHRDGFLALHDDWRDDFAKLEHVFITQVRPGCGTPSLELRDYQRLLSRARTNAHTMSTSAMDAHDGCHYNYTGGYEILGEHYALLLTRHLYGQSYPDFDAIDVESATYDSGTNTIRVQTRSDASAFTVEAGMAVNFAVLGTTSTVSGVTMSGTVMVLQLTAGTGTPTEIQYNAHQGAGATLLNARGVGLLAFRLTL